MPDLNVRDVPKCLEDKVYTERRRLSIKTSDGKNISNFFNYCPKCKSYITSKGMEEDLKKVALDFFQSDNFSYELSDIVEVIEVKP